MSIRFSTRRTDAPPSRRPQLQLTAAGLRTCSEGAGGCASNRRDRTASCAEGATANRSRKPAVIRRWPFGGYTRAPGQQIIYGLHSVPPPYHFLKDTPPSPPTQSLYLPPLLGRKPLMHILRFRVLCLPRLYCTTHRIRMNWGEIGRRGLAVDLLLGDHQNPAFRFCACPDFMHFHRIRMNLGKSDGVSLCLRS